MGTSGLVGRMNYSVVFSSILDPLSFRWFTRSNVSGVNSVNLMANWLAMCYRWSRASLPVVAQWY